LPNRLPILKAHTVFNKNEVWIIGEKVFFWLIIFVVGPGYYIARATARKRAGFWSPTALNGQFVKHPLRAPGSFVDYLCALLFLLTVRFLRFVRFLSFPRSDRVILTQ